MTGRTDIDWRLLRFLLRNCATGIAAAWAMLLGLIWTDAAGIGALIHGSDHGALALFMLAGGFAITGGGVGMGLAVMALARRES